MRDSLRLMSYFFLASFFGHSLVFRQIEEGAHLLPHFNQRREGFLDFGSCSLLLDQSQNGNDVDKIFLVVPTALGGHLDFVLSESLTLICSVSHFSRRSVGGTCGMGGLTGGVPFSHLAFFWPSGGDLRSELMAYCQSEVSNKRRLKELLGGIHRIL